MIQFSATIPDIQSAVNISGNRHARIKLDVSEQDIAQVVKLMTVSDKVLKVTVEIEE